MKLDEFKKIEEEFRFSDLFGTNIGSDSKVSQKVPGKVALQAFVNDLIDDATTKLDSAIQGGLVDPTSTDPARPPRAPRPPKPKPAPPAPTTESKNYEVLNYIFENILEASAKKPVSIANYLRNYWYPSYMQGVNYASRQKDIDNIFNNIQATYATDKGKAGFTKLAHLSSALNNPNAPSAQPKAEPSTEPKPPAPTDDKAIKDYVLRAIEQLKKTNPEMYNEILDALTKP